MIKIRQGTFIACLMFASAQAEANAIVEFIFKKKEPVVETAPTPIDKEIKSKAPELPIKPKRNTANNDPLAKRREMEKQVQSIFQDARKRIAATEKRVNESNFKRSLDRSTTSRFFKIKTTQLSRHPSGEVRVPFGEKLAVIDVVINVDNSTDTAIYLDEYAKLTSAGYIEVDADIQTELRGQYRVNTMKTYFLPQAKN